MARLKWNRNAGGGSQISSLRGEARQAAGFGLSRPQWGRSKPTTKKGKLKRVFDTAKALAGAEKGRKIVRAVYGPPPEKIPARHTRLVKQDPITHAVNTVDIPILQRTLGKILDMLAKKKPFNAADFGISEAHKVFIATGRWEPNNG